MPCTLVLFAFAFAGEAAASELIGREADRADLQVNGAGQAHVSWSEGGVTRHVVAGNAINARPPHPGIPQVSFQLRYGARSIPGATCGRYDGPPLAWVVVACKAPDGSYWALQRWQRLKPNYGGKTAGWELRLSHWSGPLPVLEVWTDWAYRRFDHLYGRYTYQGRPVHGFRVTPQGSPLDELRPQSLRGHAGLALRGRLAPREQLSRPASERCLLLRLLPARRHGRQGRGRSTARP